MGSDYAADPTATAQAAAPRRTPVPVKILVAGGFGVGKTTAVATISEIAPLTTEAAMTSVAAGQDDVSLIPGKTTTTVAMDFGRVTIDESVKLYVFGTPGQDRFGFMWGDLAQGALGAVVIVDDRRIDDCYPAVDYFERSGLPFVVAVNRFDGQSGRDLETIRWALAVAPTVPVTDFDARSFASVRDTFLVLLEEALARARAHRNGGRPSGVAAGAPQTTEG
jgi:hypothetical protein